MSEDAEYLLEVDRLEDVLADTAPTQPVVVVQYATKRRARLWVTSLIFIIPLGAMVLYHRREVERLRWQAISAKREAERWKEKVLLEADRQALMPPDRGRSSTPPSQPAVAPPVDAVPSPAQASARSNPASPQGAPIAKPAAATADRSPSPSGSDFVRDAGPDPSPAHPSEPAPTAVASSDPTATAEAPPGDPFEAAGPAVDAAAKQTPLVAQSPTAGGTAPSVAPMVAVPADPPLPSKEETERMLQAEALQKQAEIRRQVEDQVSDIHRLRYDERVRFHQELRETLEKFGKTAGPEIDQLCARFGYESDPRRVFQGSQYWFGSTRPFANRARKIREELDLPETAILNYISDGLNEHRRRPGGPRDSNEVRVRAAVILLNCELPPFEQTGRMTAAAPRSITTANRRPANPSPRAAPAAQPR